MTHGLGQEAFVGVNPIKQIIKELTQQCPRLLHKHFISIKSLPVRQTPPRPGIYYVSRYMAENNPGTYFDITDSQLVII